MVNVSTYLQIIYGYQSYNGVYFSDVHANDDGTVTSFQFELSLGIINQHVSVACWTPPISQPNALDKHGTSINNSSIFSIAYILASSRLLAFGLLFIVDVS